VTPSVEVQKGKDCNLSSQNLKPLQGFPANIFFIPHAEDNMLDYSPETEDKLLETLDAPWRLPAFVDSSMIATFRACPRKFWLQYCHNLKPRGGLSVHLAAGAAMAAGLNAARKAQGLSITPLEVDELLEAAFGPFCKEYVCESDPNHPKNFHNTFNALEQYLTQFHPFYDPIQPLRDAEGNVTSEFSFAIPTRIQHPSGDPFLYVGRFDLLGRYAENDLLVVLDDKTTGSLGSYWLRQWDMRGQFMGYIWALQRLGYDVHHAVVRGVGLLKTDINFATVPLEYPQHLLERWEEELYHTLEMMKLFASTGHWPYSFADACSSYGGCPMQDLCKNRNPDAWLVQYKVEVWNPVHEDS
jgi:hypothetical protein